VPGAQRSKSVQSVDRAVGLLRAMAVSGTDLSLAELAARCGLERPTAWRLLLTLEANGLVDKVEPAHYRLTPGWHGLTHPHAVDSLVRLAHSVLEEAARRLEVTASLVTVQRLRLEYVDQVDGPAFASPRWEGALSLHASSPGKAVLAALPDREWQAMVGTSFEQLTETTVTDPDAFATEIATIREQGYAICRGEDVTYSNGASAAILSNDRPVAAIDLWGPDRRVDESRLHELGTAAAASAADIQTILT
jgi:DNA-binding IclR family transcriptional regulator